MQLLIYGSKEFAATVAELIRHCGHESVGMVDDVNTGPGIIGGLAEARRRFPPSLFGIVLAIGYSKLHARWSAWERIVAAGYTSPSLIHPRAYVADTAQVGHGCMVMAGAIVDVRAKLGDAVVAWPGACINHDVVVGHNTFLSPNSTICGGSVVGANTFIGAGAAVADHCSVPSASFIKMQSRFIWPK